MTAKKTFAEAVGNYWKPFPYEKQVQDAMKVEAKMRQLKEKKCSPGTLHGKTLTYISHELKADKINTHLWKRLLI